VRNLVRNLAVLGNIFQQKAMAPCPIGAIPDELSPW
jgi:hypothetical protein